MKTRRNFLAAIAGAVCGYWLYCRVQPRLAENTKLYMAVGDGSGRWVRVANFTDVSGPDPLDPLLKVIEDHFAKTPADEVVAKARLLLHSTWYPAADEQA